MNHLHFAVRHTDWLHQVNNFLNMMANEIDHQIPGVVENPDKLPGKIVNVPGLDKDADLAPKPEYSVLRRRMDMKMAL